MLYGFLKPPLFKGHCTKIITRNVAMFFLVPILGWVMAFLRPTPS